MKPEMKSTRNEISTHHKKNSIYTTFHCERNEMNFVSWEFRNNRSIKLKPIILVYASADASFHMISFRLVFTWYFIIRNEISFLSKWPQWNGTRSEFHFGLYHVSSCKKFNRHRNENISFRPRWNLMQTPSRSILVSYFLNYTIDCNWHCTINGVILQLPAVL